MAKFEIRWSEEAYRGMHEACEYLERHESSWNAQMLAEVLEGIEKLRELPRLGSRFLSSDDANKRVLTTRHFQIIYLLVEEEGIVHLATIRHQRQGSPPYE